MKKRILAIVLACLMLVSVLPTSAFAVEHNHNLDTGKCPSIEAGYDVGTDGHNKTNCDWGEGPLFTVAPMCGELGYSVYECQGCGTHFIADTTYGEGGSHEYGELIAAVAPNCAEQKDGTLAHYQCATCKKFFNEQKVQISSIVDPWKHTWIANSGDDVDCTKDGMICAVCGATKAVENAHKWGKVEIDTYPTVNTTGRAVEKCTNEGCTVSRYILIEKQCIHPADSLTKVEGTPATCDQPGKLEHYTCSECTKANNGKTVYLLASKGDRLTRYYVVTEAMITVEALGHDFGENKVETVDAKCHQDGSLTNGYTYRHCDRCEKDVILTTIEAEHELEWLYRTEPTCTTYGADNYLCKICGYMYQERLEPLNHYGFDKGINQTVTAPTCNSEGKREWTCGRVVKQYDAEGVLVSTTTCTEKFEEKIATVNHNFVNLEISNNCVTGGWAMSFCTYDDCSLPLKTVTDSGESIADLVAQYNAAKGTSIVVPAEGVHLENFQAYTKYDCGHSQFGHDESCRLKHRWKQYGLNEPTCFEEGSIAWICLDCNASWHEKIDKLAHNFTILISDTPSTCVQAGSKVMQCSNPGCTEQQVTNYDAISQDEINNIYNWLDKNGDRVADPTLTGRPYIQQVHTNLVDFVDANIVVEDLENFDANDPAVRDGKYHQMIKGNCETVGIYFIWCDDCGRGLYVTDGFTGNEPHKIDKTASDYVAQKDATCFESGWSEKGHCSVCGYVMVGELIPALHNDPNAVELVPAVTPVCGGIGVKQHWKCDCMGYEKYYLTDKPTSEADVLTEEEHDALHFKLEHKWSEHCVGYQNCTEFAYVHMVCLNDGCKYGATKDYYGVLTNGNPDSKNFTDLQDGRALGHDMQEADCENDAYCARRGCGLVIEGTALGHVNKDGQTLTHDCTDAAQWEITDRICVRGENCPCYGEYPEYGYTDKVAYIEFYHDEYNVIREGNCIEYACEITLCKLCLTQLKYHQGEKGDHEWKPKAGAPVASYVTETTEYCVHCGLERIYAMTGIQFTATATNANVPGVDFVDSSLVKLNIRLESVAQVGVQTFRFQVKYDADNMYYVGFERIFDDLFANVSDDLEVMIHDDGKGTVTCLFVADNNEAGELQNVIVSKLELVNLFFRIRLTHENNQSDKMNGAATNQFSFNIENVEILDADKDNLTVDKYDAEGKLVEIGVGVTNAQINVEALGDTDNTGGRELSDVQRAYELFITGGYHIGADINQNGEIDMEDLLMAYQYAIDAIDYIDLWYCGVDE